MVQFRRLDPLANASLHQRLLKSPVKSYTLTEEQFETIQSKRPELVSRQGDAAVVGRPHRGYLEVHYGFPDVPQFRDHFAEVFEAVTNASNKQEAPRGVLLSFRDRPNRDAAEKIFWLLALDEGRQWVEMDWVAVPEQPEPGVTVADRFVVREAGEKDRDAIAAIEAEISGEPKLDDASLNSLYENARWLRVVTDAGGETVGFLSLGRQDGGWGTIDQIALRPSHAKELGEPLLKWSIAWLRNNGGRRLRKRVYLDDAGDLALLRSAGFLPAETGIDYSRPVDAADVRTKIANRQSHGSMIKFGDWR